MASIKRCKQIIEAGRKAGVAVWIWGPHGNGKSQIVEQVAKKLDIQYNDIRISLTEAGDWMGLPFINPVTKRMEFAPSPYLPHDSESSGILFLDECLPGETRIVTPEGNKTIHALVMDFYKKYYHGEKLFVTSFNVKTQSFENKEIINVWEKGKKKVITLKFGNKKITCTPNHKILTSKGYKEAKNFAKGDLGLFAVSSETRTASPALNHDQLHLVYGSILGDGAFNKASSSNNKYISIIHGEPQKEYCLYKASILGRKIRLIKQNGFSGKPAYTFHSRIIPELSFLSGKKEAKLHALKNLNTKSLAIWYMDDGSKTTNHDSGMFHTEGWPTHITNAAIEKLNSMGYTCNYQKIKKVRGNATKNYGIIYITAKGFRKLSEDIAKFVLPSMRYKLAEKDKNVPFVSFDGNYQNYGYWGFTSFVKNPKNRNVVNVYDIEIKDNHNFVVASKERNNGLVVHNCNRGRPDVIQCVFQLILDKKIGTHYELPKGWNIIAAANPGDADYQVTDIDPALLGRFCHIHLTPTKDEWLDFAKEVGIRGDVRAFIQDNPKMLGQATSEFRLEHVKGNPRGYDLLSRMVNALEELGYLDECLMDVASGLIGPEGACEYDNYRKNQFKRIDVTKILDHYPDIREDVLKFVDKGRGDLGKEAITELLVEKKLPVKSIIGNDKKFNNLFMFLSDLPADLAYCASEIILNNYRPLMDALLSKKDNEAARKFHQVVLSLAEFDNKKKEEKESTKKDKASK